MPAQIVRHRSPVVVSHPVTQQYVTLARGMEVDDPEILREFAWAFEEPTEPVSSSSVRIADVEQATREPGERRATRRPAAPA